MVAHATVPGADERGGAAYSAAVTLQDVHDACAWVLVVGNGVAGAWTLAAHWLAPLRVRVQWWSVVAAQVTVAVQVGLGVALETRPEVAAPGFHTFYGFVTLITVALLFAHRHQLRANLYLLYGLGSLFLMGLGIRAMFLA